MKNCTAFALTLSWWICVPVPSLAASYTFTWLGGLGSEGYAINNLGQVVGVSTDMGFPCLFVGGTAQPVVDWEGEALGINDRGEVVGRRFEAPPFLYSNGTVQDLVFPGASPEPIGLGGLGINNKGDVAGAAIDADGRAVGFVYSAGVMHGLGVGNYPNAINDQGQMAGEFTDGYFYSNGISWNPGTLPGATRYFGAAINEKGDVAGYATVPDGDQYFGAEAFAYINGIMHDLGPGYAYGINESGQVVGESRGGAFLYSGGSMYLLADLVPIRQFLSLYYGAAINDVGQITGLGDPGGSVQAFLLTPIPEPSSLVIAALGLIGLAAWGWRRKRSA